MWPFGKRLSGQDPVEKYRRWLRRWLLGSWLRYAVIGSTVISLIAFIIWAVLGTWPLSGRSPATVPARDLEHGVQVVHSRPLKTIQPSDVQELAVNASSGFKICAPVDGRIVQPYGSGYSELYGDFRFNRSVAFSAATGALVTAAAPGKVGAVRPGPALEEPGQANANGASGNPVPVSYTVIIDHGSGWQTVYRGLGEVRVKTGQSVAARAPLGTLPRSGKVLEFTLLKNGVARNPADYLVENIHR
ncbi:MAG: murein hydrolase activator EnvC family protein [Desulfofundulus sp.]